MRYRYIFSGGIKAQDNISCYRLLDKQKMQGHSSAIRVEIPNNAKLEKWECDEYSTWDSGNENDYQLIELNPKICVKINGTWNILENATNEWLNGTEMRDAIQNSLKDKYYSIPMFNIGYITKEQYSWYQNNIKYAWRLDKFPLDLINIQIPPLTQSELETLSYVRELFNTYYEEIIDDSFHFEDDDKQNAKEFFKEFFKNISDDDLAYEWHRHSTSGLDPNQKFETKEMVEKMRKSRYLYVSNDHYKYAIKNIIENMSIKFHLAMRDKEKEDDYER